MSRGSSALRYYEALAGHPRKRLDYPSEEEYDELESIQHRMAQVDLDLPGSEHVLALLTRQHERKDRAASRRETIIQQTADRAIAADRAAAALAGTPSAIDEARLRRRCSIREACRRWRVRWSQRRPGECALRRYCR